jgi:hypothetical protein
MSIAPSDVELPEIDFKKYTLVIGQHGMGAGYQLERQFIDTESDMPRLNLVYSGSETGGSLTAMLTYCYWGVYPKLSEKTMNLSITYINIQL